jgi:hypothetical protein
MPNKPVKSLRENGQSKSLKARPKSKEAAAITDNTLYTIVLDYKGGTCIGQTLADSVPNALTGWLAGITDEELARWQITRKTGKRPVCPHVSPCRKVIYRAIYLEFPFFENKIC